MFCPILIILLSLALIVTMSGLYFLSYVRREEHGLLYKIVGNVTVVFGISVFVGGIVAALFNGFNGAHGECSKHGCHRKNTKDCMNEGCANERIDRHVNVYRYTTKGDTLKGDKTVVRKEVEVIRN